jgi:hypothetical protein
MFALKTKQKHLVTKKLKVKKYSWSFIISGNGNYTYFENPKESWGLGWLKKRRNLKQPVTVLGHSCFKVFYLTC